eukprot:3940788-Rhodomonas_salina.2
MDRTNHTQSDGAALANLIKLVSHKLGGMCSSSSIGWGPMEGSSTMTVRSPASSRSVLWSVAVVLLGMLGDVVSRYAHVGVRVIDIVVVRVSLGVSLWLGVRRW